MFGALLLATALRPCIAVLNIKEIPPVEGETVASVEAGRISSTGYVTLEVYKSPDSPLPEAEVWNQASGSVVVPDADASDPGCMPIGINSKGVVVGMASGGRPWQIDQKLFVWPASSEPPLPQMGISSVGADINDSGVIVGIDLPSQGDPERAIKIENGVLNVLQPLNGYTYSAAYAVNNGGEVAGVSVRGGQPLATVWDSKGTPIMVPLLPNTFRSEAGGLNDKGEIVGICSPGDRAFLYSTGGVVPITVAGGSCRPSDINNFSQVVGTLYYSPTDTAAFLYQSGNTQNLNDLLPSGSGWVLKKATGINDKGQVVGDGIYQGKPRAFILQLG